MAPMPEKPCPAVIVKGVPTVCARPALLKLAKIVGLMPAGRSKSELGPMLSDRLPAL